MNRPTSHLNSGAAAEPFLQGCPAQIGTRGHQMLSLYLQSESS